MSNAKIFLEKFKEIEDFIRRRYEIDMSKSIKEVFVKDKHIKYRKDDIEFLIDIRNILSHKADRDPKPIIEPNDYVIALLEDVYNWVLKPKKAIDIATKNVLSCNLNDNIYPFMLKMKENGYSYIPILDNGFIVGIFSETTLFAGLIEYEMFYEQDKSKFCDKEILKYCKLKNHISERFEFVSRNMYLEEVQKLFNKSCETNKRLAMVLVTENGKENEKLLGVITPWDILKY